MALLALCPFKQLAGFALKLWSLVLALLLPWLQQLAPLGLLQHTSCCIFLYLWAVPGRCSWFILPRLCVQDLGAPGWQSVLPGRVSGHIDLQQSQG